MFEHEVAEGAAWLDEKEPGWERKIDVGTLNLSHGCFCVLGQVCGNYSDVTDAWRNDETTGIETQRIAARRGFMVIGTDNDDPRWGKLQDTWVALIKERFDSGALSDVTGKE